MDDRDTIVALSTPPGQSGIAVVRISGPRAVEILDGMAQGARSWSSHTLHRRALLGERSEPLDEVVSVVMRAPNSYTGEDVVEISCHGGLQVVSELMEEIIRRGARTAGPGEFTRRAYLNGRIDLIQAEAVVDIISAETKLQRQVALEHLEGTLSKKVREIEALLLDQLAIVEVSIDFSEEDIPTYTPQEMRGVIGDLRDRIVSLLDSEVAGGKLRSGIRITILGPRNAGKSSLYNTLLGEERAIVSPIPGTTRDLLRERIHIGGFTYYLEDTAGIAETGCEIEAMGISMGRRAAAVADLILFVIDGSEVLPADLGSELSRFRGRNLLCVLNKEDLGLKATTDDVATVLGVERVVAVSAVEGTGLETLKEMIYASTISRLTGEINKERIAINARQGAALREAHRALDRLEEALEGGFPAEILSMEIRAAADACGMVTGRSITEDLLDTIFNRFCIGK